LLSVVILIIVMLSVVGPTNFGDVS
jgi:hypothetical protein